MPVTDVAPLYVLPTINVYIPLLCVIPPLPNNTVPLITPPTLFDDAFNVNPKLFELIAVPLLGSNVNKPASEYNVDEPVNVIVPPHILLPL
jgi:hypothetical protein